MAVDTIERFDDAQTIAVFDCIRFYCGDLVAEDGAFNISNEHDLKLLLYGIEQRFYTTPDGRERRLANSVITLN